MAKAELPDRAPVTLDPSAFWDAQQGIFRVRVHGSHEFAAVVILEDAPLPLADLDTSEHNKKTALGAELHERLQNEVNAAIARGARQVAVGISLLTHAQMKEL